MSKKAAALQSGDRRASSASVTAFFLGDIHHYNPARQCKQKSKKDRMSVLILPKVTKIIINQLSILIVVLRAGYLTLFERTDNTAAVYKEFRKFDDLLTKLARCSLKRGKLYNSN